MRQLTFAPHDRTRRFVICYTALCHAPAQLDGRTELRHHGSLLTKLESLAVEANPNRGENESASYASPNGGRVEITEPEYQILKRFLNAAMNVPFLRPVSRELDLAIEWIENLPEQHREPASV